MFKSTYQKGLLSVLFSGGSRPLAIWESSVRNGHIRRVVDEDTGSLVLEITGTNVATTYICCPTGGPQRSLAIILPFFAIVVKNLKRYFMFEIQILDNKDMRRRFRVGNFKSCTRVNAFSCTMPLGLNTGWNLVQFNLADFVKRAYGTTYMETQRILIHANCRIRRIYFSDRIYTEEELPADYKLYAPFKSTKPARQVKQVVEILVDKTVTTAAMTTEVIDLVAPFFPTPYQLQITLPHHTSLGFTVPPPSDAGSEQPPDFEVEVPLPDAGSEQPPEFEVGVPLPDAGSEQPPDFELAAPRPDAGSEQPPDSELAAPRPDAGSEQPPDSELAAPRPDAGIEHPPDSELAAPRPDAQPSDPAEHSVEAPEDDGTVEGPPDEGPPATDDTTADTPAPDVASVERIEQDDIAAESSAQDQPTPATAAPGEHSISD